MEHKHKWASGWINRRNIFRECVVCREVRRYTINNRRPEIVRGDYQYYKRMAEFYGI